MGNHLSRIKQWGLSAIMTANGFFGAPAIAGMKPASPLSSSPLSGMQTAQIVTEGFKVEIDPVPAGKIKDTQVRINGRPVGNWPMNGEVREALENYARFVGSDANTVIAYNSGHAGKLPVTTEACENSAARLYGGVLQARRDAGRPGGDMLLVIIENALAITARSSGVQKAPANSSALCRVKQPSPIQPSTILANLLPSP